MTAVRRPRRAWSDELLPSLSLRDPMPVRFGDRTFPAPSELIKATANLPAEQRSVAARAAFRALAGAHREELIGTGDDLILWRDEQGRHDSKPATTALPVFQNLGGRVLMAERSQARGDSTHRATRLAVFPGISSSDQGWSWVAEAGLPAVLDRLRTENELGVALIDVRNTTGQLLAVAADRSLVPVWAYHGDLSPISSRFPLNRADTIVRLLEPARPDLQLGSTTIQMLADADAVLVITGERRVPWMNRVLRAAGASAKPLVMVDAARRTLRCSWPHELPPVSHLYIPIGRALEVAA